MTDCCSIDPLAPPSVLHCKSTSNGVPDGEHNGIYSFLNVFFLSLSVIYDFVKLSLS